MSPQALVQEVTHLFTLPDVAIRLNEMIEQPGVTTRELEEVVQLDAGLTTVVLKLANSAWYGLPSRVETVGQAITLVGHRKLRDLVLAASVITTFNGIPEDLVDMLDFWDNSVTCGVIARNLAQRCRSREADRLFLGGLLHKVGRLAFYAARPVQYRQVLMAQDGGEAAVVAAETRVFGFSYAALGAALLKAWRVPEIYRIQVEFHLDPLLAPEYVKEAAMVHVASELAAHMAPDIKARQRLSEALPEIDPLIWQTLSLDQVILAEVQQESLIQAFELLEIINPRGGRTT
jgi:HD-like signal output (HDOD) protein